MSIKKLESFPAYYWKSYEVFRSKCQDCPYEYDIGDDVFREKVVDVLPKQEPLKILGIGSGQGGLDCIHMRRILTRVSRIENTVVEPSIEAVEVYKSLLSGDFSHRVTTSWYRETFQQYKKRREITGATDKFHFISTVHSLYYTEKDGSTIGYMIDLLEKGGVLFIITQDDNSGFVKFSGRVAKSYGPRFSNIEQGCMTPQVVKQLDADGRVTYVVVSNTRKFDVTPCFEAESSEGSMILDVMSHTVDFKTTISKDVFQSLLDYLKSPDCSEVLSDGRIMLHVNWDAIIVTKK